MQKPVYVIKFTEGIKYKGEIFILCGNGSILFCTCVPTLQSNPFAQITERSNTRVHSLFVHIFKMRAAITVKLIAKLQRIKFAENILQFYSHFLHVSISFSTTSRLKYTES